MDAVPKKPERSAWLTGVGIAGTFITGLLFTLLVPSFNNNWSTNTSEQPEQLFHNVYSTADFKGDGRQQRKATDLHWRALNLPLQLAGYTPLQRTGDWCISAKAVCTATPSKSARWKMK